MADGAPMTAIEQRWFSAAELACLPGVPATVQGINARSARDGWTCRPRAGRGGGREYAFTALPQSTQAALLLRARPAIERKLRAGYSAARIAALWARYERVKQPLKDTAAMRLKAVQTIDAMTRTGTPVMDARAMVATQLQAEGVRGVSAPNLARWQKTVEGAHASDWLALLVPHYAGRSVTAEMPVEAWELFKADWLRLEQPSASSCYDRLTRIAAVRGWELPRCAPSSAASSASWHRR